MLVIVLYFYCVYIHLGHENLLTVIILLGFIENKRTTYHGTNVCKEGTNTVTPTQAVTLLTFSEIQEVNYTNAITVNIYFSI